MQQVDRAWAEYVKKHNSTLASVCTIRNVLVGLFLLEGCLIFIVTFGLLWSSGTTAVSQVMSVKQNSLFRQTLADVSEFLLRAQLLLQEVNTLTQVSSFNVTSLDQWAQLLLAEHNASAVSSIIFANVNGEMVMVDEEETIFVSIPNGENATLNTYIYDKNTMNPIIALPMHLEMDNPQLKPWYLQARSLMRPSWTPIYRPLDDNAALVIAAGAPVTLDDGTFYGALAVRLSLATMNAILAALTASYNNTAMVFAFERISGHLLGASTNAATIFSQDGIYRRVQAKYSMDPLISSIAFQLEDSTEMLTTTNHFTANGSVKYLGKGYVWNATSYQDELGADWVIVTAVVVRNFSDIVLGQNIAALVISVIIVLAGIVAILSVAYAITNPLWSSISELYDISNLNFKYLATPQDKFSYIYEVRMIQLSMSAVKQGLVSFMKYAPVELVRIILKNSNLANKAAVAGVGMEPKYATIMFSDIADFTTLVEQFVDKEKLLKGLQDYFRIMSEKTVFYHGVVDKFIGDAVMAIFNAFGDTDKHEINCCYAALAACKELAAMDEIWRAQGIPRIHIRIGICSGECLIGNIGSDTRLNFTAIGDVVNIASRLESFNKRYKNSILVGQSTFEKAKDFFLFYWVDSCLVKGGTPLSVFSLLKAKVEATLDEIVIEGKLLTARTLFLNQQLPDCITLLDEVLAMQDILHVKMLKARVEELIRTESQEIHLVLLDK